MAANNVPKTVIDIAGVATTPSVVTSTNGGVPTGGKWVRVSEDGRMVEAFSPDENKLMFQSFEDLRYHNGPSTITLSNGWTIDFAKQTCVSRQQLFMKLELRWEKTTYSPYVIGEAIPADDAALLTQEPGKPCVVWLWWCGEWDHYSDPIKRGNDPRWRTYDSPNDSIALEVGWEKYKANPCTETATCVINNHYSATIEKMQQYKTGDPWHARPIARALYRWFWKNDQEKWESYDPQVCESIERGYIARDTVVNLPAVVKDGIGNVGYEVNLAEMCQFRKGSKFNRRDVKRVGTPLTSSHTNSLRINAEVRSFDEFYPNNWTLMAPGVNHITVEVDMSSPEAQKLVKLMNETIAAEGHGNKFGVVAGVNVDPKYFEVVAIQRLQTVRTWKAYIAAKLRLQQRWNSNIPGLECSKYLQQRKLIVPMIENASNEYYFFHGCNSAFINSLVNADKFFDTRGISLQNMFGAGLYFAEHSSKSNQYIPCPKCNLGSIGAKKVCTCRERNTTMPYSILICRVAMGNFYISKDDSEDVAGNERNAPEIPGMPGQHYDSVLGECRKYGGKELRFREVVVYDRAQMYPEYVIRYFRHEKPIKPSKPGKNC